MAPIPISGYAFSFSFLILSFIFLSANSISTIPNFDPEISLFGDAEIAVNGSVVQLTRRSVSSSGLLMYTKPLKFLEPDLSKPTSFSTEFVFSISPGSDGIALVFVPNGFDSRFDSKISSPFGVSRENRFLGVEFDTSMDENVGDLNGNHVGIDVNSLVSVSVSNVSAMNLVLSNGEKLKSWIDYDASSKRLEIRLSKFSATRPYNPILAYSIDVLEMWGNEDVFVGICSTSEKSVQTTSVYSWRFVSRKVPTGMHSLPVDPRSYKGESGESHGEQRRRFCLWTIFARMTFAIGCWALLALVLLFLWAMVVMRKTEFPIEDFVKPVDFKYEKINLVVEKGSEGVKN